jgi:hypothetical protein
MKYGRKIMNDKYWGMDSHHKCGNIKGRRIGR